MLTVDPRIHDLCTMKQALLLTAIACSLLACQNQGGADALDNNVPLEVQKKVYQELRWAMQQAGREALEAYPKSGMPEGGAGEYRDLQDSLRLKYWSEVCDSNQVATMYGDSIWTKGVKKRWRVEAR